MSLILHCFVYCIVTLNLVAFYTHCTSVNDYTKFQAMENWAYWLPDLLREIDNIKNHPEIKNRETYVQRQLAH